MEKKIEHIKGSGKISPETIAMYNKAYELAKTTHKDQTDKVGQPYMNHLCNVSENVNKFFTEQDYENFFYFKITAILHDIIEDGNVSYEYLKTEFNETIADAVKAVSREEGESYMDFIKRCSLNRIGRIVKLADLTDNLNIMRLVECPTYKITENDYNRIKKYIKAFKFLICKND